MPFAVKVTSVCVTSDVLSKGTQRLEVLFEPLENAHKVRDFRHGVTPLHRVVHMEVR
jgi:hypothetical protein